MLCYSNQEYTLLNYSHIPPVIIIFLLGFFIFIANPKSRINRVYFFSMLGFLIWIVSDYLSFYLLDPGHIIWTERFATLGIFGLVLMVIFIYIFPEDKPLNKKIISLVFLPLLPFLASFPTRLVVPRLTPAPDCDTETGIMYWYLFILVLYYAIISVYFAAKKIKILKNDQKKQIKIFIEGVVVLFLLIAFLAVFPTIYQSYDLVLFAPFSVVIFSIMCAYAIVRFKAFDVKLLGAQALITALIIIIGSMLFFVESTTNQILILISLTISIGIGYLLIRSVKLEVKRKEELQLMSDKLATANDQLRKLDNAKSEFISIASHQLRTPLTAIKGFVSLLLEGSYGKLPPKQEDVLNKVYLSNDRLVNLVEDLLNISRIESGRMEFKFELCQAEDICQEVVDTFVIKAKEHGLSLDYKKPAELLPKIMVDGAKVREVISNMVDNAIKYTPKGGVTVRVERILNSKFQISNQIQNSNDKNNQKLETKNQEHIRITVSDTGIGIPQTELPYLFAKFSRGKDVKRLNAGGTGLGLYVGRNMIEASGGKIWAESDGEGRGSRFIVELPIGENKAEVEKRLEKFIEKI